MTAPADSASSAIAGPPWVTARIAGAGLRTEVTAGSHTLIADEPVPLGGTDQGPTPYGFLLGALGACTAMTLRLYADRKGWPLEAVRVRLRTARAHERDCEDCATEKVGMTRVERNVELTGPLSDEQRTRLLQLADRCPVKQTLERGIVVVPAA